MGGMGSTGSGMIGASASKSLGSGMVGATGSGTIKSGAVGTGSMGSGMVGGTGGSGAIGEKGPVKVAESMGKEEIWRSFAKEPLETFMPLFFPSEIMEQSLFALLSINPRTVGTPERRDVVGRAIIMPDVFLQHQLVHMLVPFCGKQVSAAPIAKWSSHTLYLLLASFLRTVPDEAAERAEVDNRLRQFDTILEQFRICCQLGNPENSQGGVRVLMDLVWKLFTRRQTVVSPEVYFTMAIDGVTANNANAIQTADNFYDVRFLHKVIELLTDLCISLDGRAVTAFQTFIANELFITNEASAVRRRPEPECSDNVWSKKKMTLHDHEAENNRPGQKGKGLERLRGEKAAFTLLKLGTAIHFNLADSLLEASSEDVVIPRVLWTQDRAQPPRFENGNYTDDVVSGGTGINQARMLYFALVNLIAHLAADRHTLNSKRTKDNIPHHVVRNQLIQQEVLGCAGLMFVPQNLRVAKMAAVKINEARDLGDVSDLTALSAHVALLLHGFLGQRPFADEQKRSTIALKLYMDGTRADDDDTVFEEHGSVLALQPEDLERLCQMCSWQFASIAELCREMFYASTLPPVTFTDRLSHLISMLAKTLSKLIALGYYERFQTRAMAEGGEKAAKSEETYNTTNVVQLFQAMHQLRTKSSGITTDLYTAALTDMCRVLTTCTALHVNVNIQLYLRGCWPFLPPTVLERVKSAQAEKGITVTDSRTDPIAQQRGLLPAQVEQNVNIQRLLRQLSRTSLPWESDQSSKAQCKRNLGKFIIFLLDFVSLGDAALAIASVQLLSRLCRRRQDFLEAVRDMHLLDCFDKVRFNDLEPWRDETDAAIERLVDIEEKVNQAAHYREAEGLDTYAVAYDSNMIGWNDDDLADISRIYSRRTDAQTGGQPPRLIEYNDKTQKYSAIVRVNPLSLISDFKVTNVDFLVVNMPGAEGAQAEVEGDNDDVYTPTFIGCISPKWSPEGTDYELSKKAPSGFFGADERGNLYINGHRIEDSRFAGFSKRQRGRRRARLPEPESAGHVPLD
jgi:hypothetical protein